MVRKTFDRAKVVTLAKQGVEIKYIAQRLGITSQTVWEVLTKAGVGTSKRAQIERGPYVPFGPERKNQPKRIKK
jgi:DNA invertase Pin-like site-specific DNA recombinase